LHGCTRHLLEDKTAKVNLARAKAGW